MLPYRAIRSPKLPPRAFRSLRHQNQQHLIPQCLQLLFHQRPLRHSGTRRLQGYLRHPTREVSLLLRDQSSRVCLPSPLQSPGGAIRWHQMLRGWMQVGSQEEDHKRRVSEDATSTLVATTQARWHARIDDCRRRCNVRVESLHAYSSNRAEMGRCRGHQRAGHPIQAVAASQATAPEPCHRTASAKPVRFRMQRRCSPTTPRSARCCGAS
mmetsp:Transcript_25148/g.63976  ORF Transcript_25148/g.63976 Transcript_25148/m.63976 type:complete len:211 (+) Transcript_25148:272-904(+)